MVNLFNSKTFRPQPLQLLVTKQIMRLSCLESRAQKWPHQGCPALPSTVQGISGLLLCTKVRDIEEMSHRVPCTMPQSQVSIPCSIPSHGKTYHPMGLIGIAATVPGTFGIPNVPTDICWQYRKCVEDRAHTSG